MATTLRPHCIYEIITRSTLIIPRYLHVSLEFHALEYPRVAGVQQTRHWKDCSLESAMT